MNQKGFINMIIVIGLVIFAGIAGYFIGNQTLSLTPTPSPTPTPTPTPAPKPIPITKSECEKDSDCPSAQYSCDGTQGVGTVCLSNDPSCVPTSTIIKGICKLKEGSRCRVDPDCMVGLLCHANVCISPVGRQCNGPSDTTCSVGYECVQGCGWPVPRPDEPPPSYFCQLKGYFRPCPVCLAENTLIDTPSGAVPVQQLQKGMAIWTVNNSGMRVPATILETVRTPVPSTHQVIHLVLDDGRELFVSPGHPTGDGRTVGGLSVGDSLSGGHIMIIKNIPYQKDFTYDILPSGETGLYWANGILIGSTLSYTK